jgi:hypothetical protein
MQCSCICVAAHLNEVLIIGCLVECALQKDIGAARLVIDYDPQPESVARQILNIIFQKEQGTSRQFYTRLSQSRRIYSE